MADRTDRWAWVGTGLAAVAVGLAGLVAAAVLDPGLGSAPAAAAVLDAASSAPADASSGASPAAFARASTTVDVQQRAQQAAVAADHGALRANLLTRVTQDTASYDLRSRAADRSTGLDAEAQARATEARQLLDATIAQEQAARLAQIRAEARAAAGLDPDGGSPLALGATGVDTSGVTGTVTGSGRGASPIDNPVIGARFGQVGLWATYHTGIDFRAGYGTTIHAAADGVVVVAGDNGTWSGNHVAIRHADGTSTMYSHMSSIAAHVGDQVTAGQVIGYVGSTGRAFGPHLHFEVYPAGIQPGDVYHAVNPLPWLAAHGIRIG